MNTDRNFEILTAMLAEDMEQARKNSIFETEDGYLVFDEYSVSKNKQAVTVRPRNKNPIEFTALRYAVSWCVADKYRQYNLADEILQYDLQRKGLQNDIRTSTLLLSKIKSYDIKDVVEAKRSNKQAVLLSITDRLDKCVNVAKYWQIRGFNNEIARTRRTSPDRTNRPSDRKSQRKSH